MPAEPKPEEIAAFIGRTVNSGGAECENSRAFASEQSNLFGVPRPQ